MVQILPQLSKLFCQLQLHCLEELSYGVSFPDNNLASVACAVPVAVCHGQRFILHYLSASKHKPLLSSTVACHAENDSATRILARSINDIQPKMGDRVAASAAMKMCIADRSSEDIQSKSST